MNILPRISGFAIVLAAFFSYLSQYEAVAAAGAVTPFTTYEAEDGGLDGGASVRKMEGTPDGKISSPEFEASGRAFVELKGTGQQVSFVNKTGQNIAAMNVRFCIPDAPNGGGTTATLNLYVDGKLRQNITLNSSQCWLYESSIGNNGMSKDPAQGKPHKFFDDTHFFIQGAPVAPGGIVTLRQDADNTAAFYWIDLIDVENPEHPLIQPDGSLSITDYGAVANDKSVDSTNGIQRCFDEAKKKGKAAWIPPGVFYLNAARGLHANGITVAGAGMWYSTIYHNVPLPNEEKGMGALLEPTSCTVRDICFDGNAIGRTEVLGDGAGLNVKGEHWLVDRVWVQHASSGLWGDGSDGVVQNSRMMSTWGDGINLNNGNSGNSGDNLTAQNNYVRGTGDDGLAINSDASSIQMHHIKVLHNTSTCVWWANGLGVYGGSDDLVEDNLVCDAETENGLSIGVFGDQGAALESAVVQRNVIIRSGVAGHAGLAVGTENEHNSIANVYVGGNSVLNSFCDGMAIRKGVSVVLQNNAIDGPAGDGIVVKHSAAGDGIFTGNTVTNLKDGRTDFVKGSPKYTIITPVAATTQVGLPSGNTEPCSEGGQDLGQLNNRNVVQYHEVDLGAGISTFVARVAAAGAGGTISVYLDNPKGTPIGACTVSTTGGSQLWSTQSCPVTAASGVHDVYLVISGNGNGLLGLQWFAFRP